MLRSCCVLLLLMTAACNLQFGEPTPFPTPDFPQIDFELPANNASIVEGGELEILLLAQDTSLGITRVELIVDDLPFRESQPEISGAVPVFRVNMNWLAEGIGFHSLTAIAYRPDGTASRPRTINVLVTSADES
jgi:hypothetical protein